MLEYSQFIANEEEIYYYRNSYCGSVYIAICPYPNNFQEKSN